jgi:hypothetical protein
MKDRQLAELNFHDLLDYGGQPPVHFEYRPPICCKGYCLSCEDSGLLKQTGHRLDLMSHGCDTSDFEAVLGPLPTDGRPIEQPILFLLENPGADNSNGEPVRFRGFAKQPPVGHYYWTPNCNGWPSTVDDFRGNFYGSYFAYLMRTHHLRNVYITNLVKCKWVANSHDAEGRSRWNPQVIVDHCAERYLGRELKILGPRIAFCFGRKAEAGLRKLLGMVDWRCKIRYLWHPAAIRLAQRYGKMPPELICQNDKWVKEEITHLADEI